MARLERVLRSMSLNTRDAHGYPLQGVDVVPERPKPKDTTLSKLIKFLREATQREEEANRRAEHWRRAYDNVNGEYLALKYGDLCSECKRVKDGTEAGDTFCLCVDCRDRGDHFKVVGLKNLASTNKR